MKLDAYDLVIFDVDGTLVEVKEKEEGLLYTEKFLPGVEEKLKELTGKNIALCSNQGGVGLRYWMELGEFGEPEKYPTEDSIWERMDYILSVVGEVAKTKPTIYLAFRYQAKSGNWGPAPTNPGEAKKEWTKDWRKPNTGMLLAAMKDFNVKPAYTVMIGDSDSDREAAEKADIDFIWAEDFFNVKNRG